MNGLLTIYPGNDNLLELQNLTKAIDGTAETGAAVSVTLRDSAGEPVAGSLWPVALSHVGATPGTYRALLGPGIAVTSGSHYTATINAITGDGLVGRWDVELIAQTRRR